MCLKLNFKNQIPLETLEDIVVYKTVIKVKEISLDCQNIEDLHGVPFKGMILDEEFEGILSVKEDKVFLCTNYAWGLFCDEKFGFKYSWVFTDSVTSLIVNDVELVKISFSFETPFRNYPIEIGNTYTSKLVKKGDNIEEGLHSFEFARDAKLTNWALWYDEGTIVKCIIPKGSTYYKGTFDGDSSYASDALTYVEIVQS